MNRTTSNTISVLFLTLLLSFVGFGQERYLKPIDGAAKDKSFLAFRNELLKAVDTRNTAFIYGIVVKDIKNGFGGEDGILNFKKQWKLNSPKSDFWKEFGFAIKNGGNFQSDNSFVAPYTFSDFPADLDGFEHQAIIGENVRLREKPDISAGTVALLSYNIVKFDYEKSLKDPKDNEKYLWIKVETLGGKKGYVAPQFIRSPIDYRAGFEKIRGKWKLTFFLAGD